jgi:hypothetical protein
VVLLFGMNECQWREAGAEGVGSPWASWQLTVTWQTPVPSGLHALGSNCKGLMVSVLSGLAGVREGILPA